jgi:hypothetical protein
VAGFIAAGGVLTALGRVRFNTEQALVSRYATPVVAFWLAIVLLGAGRFPSGRRRLAVMALTIPGLIVIAISQPRFAETARRVAAEQTAAIPAVLAGVADPILSRLYLHGSRLTLERRASLLAAHTSVFAEDWSRWLGTPLASHVAVAGAELCHGSFAQALSLADDARHGWRAIGLAWSATGSQPLRKIVLVDSALVVRGYGLGGFSAEVVEMPAANAPQDDWWIGAFTGDDPSAVTAYALLGHTACPLGPPRRTTIPPKLVVSNMTPATLTAGGYVDTISILPNSISFQGWGMVQSDGAQVVIDTNLVVRSSKLRFLSRPDVASALKDPRLDMSGIAAEISLDDRQPPTDKTKLCIWTDDPILGRHLLTVSPKPGLCPAGSP